MTTKTTLQIEADAAREYADDAEARAASAYHDYANEDCKKIRAEAREISAVASRLAEAAGEYAALLERLADNPFGRLGPNRGYAERTLEHRGPNGF